MHDIILYGATGFTGKLVAEHLLETYGVNGDLDWAIAGRSLDKLEQLCEQYGASEPLPIIQANAASAQSLDSMAASAKVIISTVGPYQLYGEPLIEACIRNGTAYVDLCGEVAWMAQMVERYEQQAKETGARIIFSCGYDSVPFDLGVFLLQELAMTRFGQPARRVRTRIRDSRGELSGGTIASGIVTIEAASKDRNYRARLEDPFSLTPGFDGPPQPDGDTPYFDETIQSWVSPFVMAPINTKNIHRSNHLLGFPYGKDFLYDEMEMQGAGEAGEKRANKAARQARLMDRILGIGLVRTLLKKTVLPKSGEGPSLEKRNAGHYDILFIGHTVDDEPLVYCVKGDKDPGYGSTSKMIAETAVCLVEEAKHDTPLTGGIWTPATALGHDLVKRLERHAGIRFIADAEI